MMQRYNESAARLACDVRIDIVQVSAKPAKADVKIKEGDAVKKSEKAIKKVEGK